MYVCVMNVILWEKKEGVLKERARDSLNWTALRSIPLKSIQQRDTMGAIQSCLVSRDGLSVAFEWEKGGVEVWSITGCKLFSSPPLDGHQIHDRTPHRHDCRICWNYPSASLYFCNLVGRKGNLICPFYFLSKSLTPISHNSFSHFLISHSFFSLSLFSLFLSLYLTAVSVKVECFSFLLSAAHSAALKSPFPLYLSDTSLYVLDPIVAHRNSERLSGV